MSEAVAGVDSKEEVVAFGRCKTCKEIGLYGHLCNSFQCNEKRRMEWEESADMSEGEGQWNIFDVNESTKFLGKPLDELGNVLEGFVLVETYDDDGMLSYRLEEESRKEVEKEVERQVEWSSIFIYCANSMFIYYVDVFFF